MSSKNPEARLSLGDCPESPNCVCSQVSSDDTEHFIAPLTFAENESAEKVMDRLAQVLQSIPRTRIVQRSENYLHAECRSLIFRFVDDLEFLIHGDENLVHVRSASRIGYSDMGANRKRVENFRQRWQAIKP